MTLSDQVLDHILKQQGSSLKQAAEEAQKAITKEKEDKQRRRAELKEKARLEREKALLEIGRKAYGKQVFTRVKGKVISTPDKGRCPYCGGEVPQVRANLIWAGEVLSNPNADMGMKPWWTTSPSAPCSKCGKHVEVMTVIL